MNSFSSLLFHLLKFVLFNTNSIPPSFPRHFFPLHHHLLRHVRPHFQLFLLHYPILHSITSYFITLLPSLTTLTVITTISTFLLNSPFVSLLSHLLWPPTSCPSSPICSHSLPLLSIFSLFSPPAALLIFFLPFQTAQLPSCSTFSSTTLFSFILHACLLIFLVPSFVFVCVCLFLPDLDLPSDCPLISSSLPDVSQFLLQFSPEHTHTQNQVLLCLLRNPLNFSSLHRYHHLNCSCS